MFKSMRLMCFFAFVALLALPATAGQTGGSDDSSPSAIPSVYIPEIYRASGPVFEAPGGLSLMANINRYFMPQDEDTSCTVMFITNPTTAAARVTITGYTLDGTQFITTTFSIPKKSMARLCSDTVSTIAGSWQNVILINFTTYTTYAKINLPGTCKVTAHVVWNNNSAYDPLQVAPTLPIYLY